jgi:preprotein translocase subunit SecA
MGAEERRAAYASDVTYVTNSELGFDYLRDNLAQQADDLVLKRGFNFCIIDEVDSILIDEARTPLIISGQAEKPSDRYIKAQKLADAMVRDVHYTVDEKQRNVLLTEDGCGVLCMPRRCLSAFLHASVRIIHVFPPSVPALAKPRETSSTTMSHSPV